MKIVAASDWRDGIPFETAVIVAELSPGDPARCSVCGADSPLRPRTELWAFKHRHPKNHDGFVRFYCEDHLPPAPPAPVEYVPARAAAPRATVPRARRSPATPAPVERPRALCPDCYIEVPSSGICGMCGNAVPEAAAR